MFSRSFTCPTSPKGFNMAASWPWVCVCVWPSVRFTFIAGNHMENSQRTYCGWIIISKEPKSLKHIDCLQVLRHILLFMSPFFLMSQIHLTSSFSLFCTVCFCIWDIMVPNLWYCFDQGCESLSFYRHTTHILLHCLPRFYRHTLIRSPRSDVLNISGTFPHCEAGRSVQQCLSSPLEGCLTSIDCSVSVLHICAWLIRWKNGGSPFRAPFCDRVVNSLFLSPLFLFFVLSPLFPGCEVYVHWSTFKAHQVDLFIHLFIYFCRSLYIPKCVVTDLIQSVLFPSSHSCFLTWVLDLHKWPNEHCP